MTLQPGTTLGSYEILAPLGAGGMGEVYRARDAKLGREVAIKVLPEGLSQDPERMLRFEREAKALAALNHPNVATLHGFETASVKTAATGAAATPGEDSVADGPVPPDRPIPFLIMELVDGDTLADRIKRGPIPSDEALPMFLQIAAGLEAAHENGVIHRDLKPANIKTGDGSGGQAKILDFGLAKAMAPEVSASGTADPMMSQSPTLTLAATQRGEILGTAAYMSPEQARGKVVDKRTDVWAFGVCLHEALTGKRVFEGEDASMTLAALLTHEPDRDALPAAISPRLRRLLERCLEKDPRKRLRDIGEARIAIDTILGGDELETEGEPAVAVSSQSRVLLWSLASLASGALLAAAVFWVLAPEPALPQTRFSINAADNQGFENLSEFVLSPDGSKLVYLVQSQDEGRRLYLRSLDSFDDQANLIPNSEGAQFPFFSPDGQWVAFFLGPGGARTLRRVQLAGGASIAITSEPHGGYRGTWGPNGDIIIGNQREGLRRIPIATGVPELITTPDAEANALAHAHPEYLPNGRAVLFSVLGRGADEARVALLDLESGATRTLIDQGSEARYVSSGHLVYAYQGTLRAVPFDLERLEVTGLPLPLMDGVRMGPLAEAYFSIAHNGTLVYSPGGLEHSDGVGLVWMNRAGDVLSQVAEGDFNRPRISPDGRRIVVEINSSRDLYWYEVDNPVAVRLTFDPGFDLNPIWGADSKTVFFASGGTGAVLDLYSAVADGSVRDPQLVLDRDGVLQPTSVSPDGKELLFFVSTAETGNQGDIGILPLDGQQEPRMLLDSSFREDQAELSPDGRLLAYVSDRSGDPRIYVTRYPDADQHVPVSIGLAFGPRWGPDSRELFYRDVDSNEIAVAAIDLTDGLRVTERRGLFDTSAFYGRRGFDVGPDGRLLMIRARAAAAAGSGQIRVVLNWTQELEELATDD